METDAMAVEIVLRPVERADITDEYCAWYRNDDGHLDYFSGSGREFTPELIIKDFEDGRASGRWFYYLIQSRGAEAIGNIKIGPIDFRNKTSDLVCLIGNRKFVGRGLASKAIELANRIAFEKYDIRRLQSGMYASNIPSIRAYIRAGWEIEATFKGFYWVNGKPEDRVCVACFNPAYFPESSRA